jgi:hypothetical protein
MPCFFNGFRYLLLITFLVVELDIQCQRIQKVQNEKGKNVLPNGVERSMVTTKFREQTGDAVVR